jgi:hypothetical protein
MALSGHIELHCTCLPLMLWTVTLNRYVVLFPRKGKEAVGLLGRRLLHGTLEPHEVCRDCEQSGESYYLS